MAPPEVDTDSNSARTGSEDLLPGTVLDGRYEIIDVLGRGGCAVVYRVFDRTLKRELALKRLRNDRSSEAVRLRREVRIARDVRSEHLVRIYDVAGSDDSAYITMEIVRGESLEARLRREGSLSIDEAIRISRQILSALATLHDMNIVHRDVKPSNVLLTDEGEVRLADLGLAHTNRPDETAATSPDSTVGTWEYLSPEQAVGVSIGPQSDLYSFGVTLFQMVAGELPFDCDSAVGYVSAHLSRKPARLSSKRAGVPRWLDRVVARLLEKRIDTRYQSAQDVLRDLDRKRASVAPRKTALLLALPVAILVLVLATYGYFWRMSRFDHLVFDKVRVSVEAIDRSGRPLWSRENALPTWTSVYRSENQTRIALFQFSEESSPEDSRSLLVIDPQTGTLERTVRMPQSGGLFAVTDEFSPDSMRAIDLDHDGNQEIAISYQHRYWPSYSVIWNPLTDETATTLVASGHHRLVDTVDLDGDGLDELLYYGINNRMGWKRGLAAVEPRLGNETFSELSASTPDYDWLASVRTGLVWYALLDTDAALTPLPAVDEHNRRIQVHRSNGDNYILDFDGFVEDSESALPVEDRQAARGKAYLLFRQGDRSFIAKDFESATSSYREGLELANRAGAPVLAVHARQLLVRSSIRSGELDTATRLIEELEKPRASHAVHAHWEAATSYHLTGRLERAIDHYKKAIAHRVANGGRYAREYVIGAVLALLELDRSQEALELLDAFERSDFSISQDRDYLRAWIRHVAGLPQLEELDDDVWLPYEYRYWDLEIDRSELSRENVTATIDELLRSSTGFEPMLLSLKADVMRDSGDLHAALQLSRRAFREMNGQIDSSTMIRGHAELIARRYESISAQAGADRDAAEARALLDRLARQRSGM